MTIRLLAMSPSGEVFFTSDRFGIIRQHRRLGSREPVEVNGATVDWVIDRYGYQRKDRDLANWADVEAYVELEVPKTTMLAEDLPVNAVIARSAVRVMEKWLTSPADVRLVVPTVNRLLADDVVSADHELKQSLLSLSTRAAQSFQPVAVAPLLRAQTFESQRRSRHKIVMGMFDETLAA